MLVLVDCFAATQDNLLLSFAMSTRNATVIDLMDGAKCGPENDGAVKTIRCTCRDGTTLELALRDTIVVECKTGPTKSMTVCRYEGDRIATDLSLPLLKVAKRESADGTVESTISEVGIRAFPAPLTRKDGE